MALIENGFARMSFEAAEEQTVLTGPRSTLMRAIKSMKLQNPNATTNTFDVVIVDPEKAGSENARIYVVPPITLETNEWVQVLSPVAVLAPWQYITVELSATPTAPSGTAPTLPAIEFVYIDTLRRIE